MSFHFVVSLFWRAQSVFSFAAQKLSKLHSLFLFGVIWFAEAAADYGRCPELPRSTAHRESTHHAFLVSCCIWEFCAAKRGSLRMNHAARSSSTFSLQIAAVCLWRRGFLHSVCRGLISLCPSRCPRLSSYTAFQTVLWSRLLLHCSWTHLRGLADRRLLIPADTA